MKILHITNDYSGSTVYKNLFKELDSLEVSQIIYNPIRERSRIGKNKIEFEVSNSKILYRHILNHHIDRLFFPYKVWKTFRDIQNHIDFSKVDFIHAHTWYSDGGVAYLLSKKFNIPYIVTIRNTDVNIFQEKLIYLRSFGRKILDRAQNVILISASYETRILSQKSLNKIKPKLVEKIRIIPNGVDPFWIENASNFKGLISQEFNFLYVGNFTKNKNIIALLKAVKELVEEQDLNIKLHLVGSGGKDEQKVLQLIKENSNIYIYHGEVYDKSKLLNIYRSCSAFTMPSKRETFGLVYIEAMLQGLPVLYTKNEGIDGFYNKDIGEAVSINDVKDITQKLLLLYENYNNYELDMSLLKINHDWSLIAMEYFKLYSQN